MARAGITVKLTGFEEMLKSIEDAGGTINQACEKCITQSAYIVQNELKKEMQSSGLESDFISRLPPPEIKSEGNQFRATVGYEKGTYDPKNPSDGYKAVFLNYGTPHRSKHGKVVPSGFIQRAKANANKKVKKAQKEVLEKILLRLKR